MRILRIALAQINTTVGDLDGNVEKIIEALQEARDTRVDLIAFPEMAIAGYPAEDLLLKPSFLKANRAALDRVAAATQGLTAIVGFADADGDVYNAAALDTLADVFPEQERGTTEENLQAGARGNLLMALSNKFGWMVVTTGNKSEMSVGYATLYGDMAGGFAVIKDVPKTLVYELSRWRNQQPGGPVIPERSLTRPPSAELRPDQKDTDSLPPYELLDPILEAYVEQDVGLRSIVALGYDEALVHEVIRMVDANEYKRRQAPPGVRITTRAFGKDRRLPITGDYADLETFVPG